MKNKALIQLFIINFVILLTGMGLLPILPLYAMQFDASASAVGLYMGITYLAITAGSLLTGKILSRWGHRRTFTGAGILGIPALLLLGQASAFWQVILLTAIAWFAGGIGIALVNVYTGYYAPPNKRGKAFSLTFLALPLASLTGGLAIGPFSETGGFVMVFSVLALAWAIWPIIAFFGFGPEPMGANQNQDVVHVRSQMAPGQAFYHLLGATFLSATTFYLARLGTSLSMQSLNYSLSDIARTAAVGGLITIPTTYLLGSLSDKWGRKRFLALGYLFGAIAALILSSAADLWQFWLATALIYAARSTDGTAAPAMATDILLPETRSRNLPYLNAMRNLAGIAGFAAGGIIIDVVGESGMYFFAAILAIMAVPLLNLRLVRRPPAKVANSGPGSSPAIVPGKS